ncbi:uncharacterized protein LOC134459543 [Engraulis encrasicolus]|uniref:uncharacterized protein LOC134459543 n=1 Tax=Engraulis encrasicolus TaxID=184585 RepID=UPI002FD482D7
MSDGQRTCVAWEVEQNQGTEQSNEHGSASARCAMQSSFDVTVIVMLCDAEITVLHADDTNSVSMETCSYSVISSICKAIQVIHGNNSYLVWTPTGPSFEGTNSGEIKMLTLRTKGKDYVGFRFRAASKFRFLKCWKDEKNKILMVSAEPNETLLAFTEGELSKGIKLENMKSFLFQREGVTDSCKFQSCELPNNFLQKNGNEIAISNKTASGCDFKIVQSNAKQYGTVDLDHGE